LLGKFGLEKSTPQKRKEKWEKDERERREKRR
jgi:hypothetical protein